MGGRGAHARVEEQCDGLRVIPVVSLPPGLKKNNAGNCLLSKEQVLENMANLYRLSSLSPRNR